MRRVNSIVSLFLGAFIISACSECETRTEAGTGYEYLVAVTDSRTFTSDQFASIIGQSASRMSASMTYSEDDSQDPLGQKKQEFVDKLLSEAISTVAKSHEPILDKRYYKPTPFRSERQWQIERHRFKYMSTSYKGTPIVLSGVVTFPSLVSGESSEVDSYTLYSHYVLGGPQYAPSVSDDIIFTRTYFNSAVIEADFEGYGCTGDTFFAGSFFDVLAKQEVDCAMAAIEIMKQHGVTLSKDGYSDSWGYSLGGPTAMAVQRYIENEAPVSQVRALRFRSTFCGGGPFEVSELLKYFNEHPEYSRTLSMACTEGINVLPKSELDGYKNKDIWNEEIMNMTTVDGRTLYQVLFLDKNMIELPDLKNEDNMFEILYAPEAIDKRGNLDMDSKIGRVIMNMANNHCSSMGWEPKHPIYVSHNYYDDRMPYHQTKVVVDDLSVRSDGSTNENVHFWTTILPEELNSTDIVHMMESYINIAHMITFETPEELYRYSIRL